MPQKHSPSVKSCRPRSRHSPSELSISKSAEGTWSLLPGHPHTRPSPLIHWEPRVTSLRYRIAQVRRVTKTREDRLKTMALSFRQPFSTEGPPPPSACGGVEACHVVVRWAHQSGFRGTSGPSIAPHPALVKVLLARILTERQSDSATLSGWDESATASCPAPLPRPSAALECLKRSEREHSGGIKNGRQWLRQLPP